MSAVMKKIKSIIYLALALFTVSCTNDSITESENQNNLVVEAFLYAGEPVTDIRLCNTISLASNDTLSPPVNDASVWLSKNGKSYQLVSDPARAGYYKYNGTDLSIEPENNFSLRIYYHGKEISATTIVPPVPKEVSISKSTLTLTSPTGFPGGPGGFGAQDTNSIYVKWSNPDSTLYYVVVENLEASPIEISSGNFPGGMNIMRRMTFPPIPSSEFVIARRNLTYYGKHRAIVYKVNQEYADLYESRNQDSRNLNEPLTNIKNGLGVFSAFASDTVYFKINSQ
jgi:hypothetical protein